MRRGNGMIYLCLAVWLIVFSLNFPQMQGVGILTFYYNVRNKLLLNNFREQEVCLALIRFKLLQKHQLYSMFGYFIGALI